MPIYMLPNSGAQTDFFIGEQPGQHKFTSTLPALLQQLAEAKRSGRPFTQVVDGQTFTIPADALELKLCVHGTTRDNQLCFTPRTTVLMGDDATAIGTTIKAWYRQHEGEVLCGYRAWYYRKHSTFASEVSLVDKGAMGFEIQTASGGGLYAGHSSSTTPPGMACSLLALGALGGVSLYLGCGRIAAWTKG